MQIAGWGNFPTIEAEVTTAVRKRDLKEALSRDGQLIARGLGRSYGDSSLSERMVDLTGMNQFIAFDPETGVLKANAGVTLEEVIEQFLPSGWFLPVTPGTKFVTLGGAVASDVHGKNHHSEGTFTEHVLSITLMTASGRLVVCSPDENTDLFYATCGGMGLTGIIVDVTFRLKRVESAWIRQKMVKAEHIDRMIEYFERFSDATYSVAWIDCLAKGKHLGRSILMTGEHAKLAELGSKQSASPYDIPEKRKMNVPFMFPSYALNSFSVKAFNTLYAMKAQERITDSVISYDSFFYPLDGVHNWNRIYGKKGFVQYQFILPKETGAEGMRYILERISNSGWGSFLAVLKLYGKGNWNHLCFPMEGYSLALDFPMRKGLLPFLEELDQVVLDYGGRLYLTKDSRMSAETFRACYADTLDTFMTVKNNIDPEQRFSSVQSRRLMNI